MCVYSTECPAEGANARLSICALRAIAAARKGELLSEVYVDAKSKLKWKCERGHVWSASAENVKGKNSWCPVCAAEGRKLDIEQMRDMARILGGQCLSQEYCGQHVKLKWRCANGHVFEKAPSSIRRRGGNGARNPSWCSQCKKLGLRAPSALSHPGALLV